MTKKYRDYDFALKNQIPNCYVIPNGVDLAEFTFDKGTHFRQEHKISASDILLLTVGSLNAAKGHLEVTQALSKMRYPGSVTLVLNGNPMPAMANAFTFEYLVRSIWPISRRKLMAIVRKITRISLEKVGLYKSNLKKLSSLMYEINAHKFGTNRRVIHTDLDRKKLISCYFSANLFVFASKIEYSPLVLFEASAAGLPFISLDVGNAEEISGWTGCGKIIYGELMPTGLTKVDTTLLAKNIDSLLQDLDGLTLMGESGRKACEDCFNWDYLSSIYESIFMGKNLLDPDLKFQ